MKTIHSEESGLVVKKPETTEGQYEILCQDGLPLGSVSFQNGTIPELGVNGTTLEAMLAINIDRLEYLNGQFPSEYNEIALAGMKTALESLNARTADRKARDVEGKHEL